VIEAFLLVKKAGSVNRNFILELMSDAELEREWPLGLNLEEKFLVINGTILPDDASELNNADRQNVHAFAVAHVVQTLATWPEMPDEEKEHRQEVAIKAFESETKRAFPRTEYDIKLVRKPNLGHDAASKNCELEGINRALMLVQGLYDSQYASRWKPTYEVKKSRDPFKQKGCSDNALYWMAQQAAEAAKPKLVTMPSRQCLRATLRLCG